MNDMISVARKPERSKITLRAMHNELKQLRERVEDLEDLRDLNAVIARNGNRTLVPWSKAKKILEED